MESGISMLLMIPSAQLADLFSSRWEANEAGPTQTLVLEKRHASLSLKRNN